MSPGCCMETNFTINFVYRKKKKKKAKIVINKGNFNGLVVLEHIIVESKEGQVVVKNLQEVGLC